MYVENYALFTFTFTLANFCKSKKCIILSVDYRPGSKKSKKFDMTLIRHTPFNKIYILFIQDKIQLLNIVI